MAGWAYNRFRFYNPVLGGFNAQDPLGLAPRVASAQGYVDHAAYWVDELGLKAHKVSLGELDAAGVPKHEQRAVQAWLNGRDTDAYVYSYMDKPGEQMQYIGMTNNLDSRALQHGDRFGTRMRPAELVKSKLSEGADSLTRRQARAFEELGIDSYGMTKENGQLLNARHEIGINGTAGNNVREGALLWARHMLNSQVVNISGL